MVVAAKDIQFFKSPINKQQAVSLAQKFGSGGGGGSSNNIEEIPTGDIDGSNKIFNLSHTPLGATLLVFLNGVEQDNDLYSITNNVIEFVTAPVSGDRLSVYYSY